MGERESSAVAFRARARGEYKLQGVVRFRCSPVCKMSGGERERGVRPCGATVRSYVPRTLKICSHYRKMQAQYQ
jgi:hypothetical protein